MQSICSSNLEQQQSFLRHTNVDFNMQSDGEEPDDLNSNPHFIFRKICTPLPSLANRSMDN